MKELNEYIVEVRESTTFTVKALNPNDAEEKVMYVSPDTEYSDRDISVLGKDFNISIEER